jgi:hypothetical protein
MALLQRELARRGRSCTEFEDARWLATPKKRFSARRRDRGDNLSVRFHIQNSISLTIMVPPRII